MGNLTVVTPLEIGKRVRALLLDRMLTTGTFPATLDLAGDFSGDVCRMCDAGRAVAGVFASDVRHGVAALRLCRLLGRSFLGSMSPRSSSGGTGVGVLWKRFGALSGFVCFLTSELLSSESSSTVPEN